MNSKGVKNNARTPRLLLLAALLIASTATLCPAIDMKGVSLTPWDPNALLTADADQTLAHAADIGCNWIAICLWWFQDDVNATLIAPDYSRYCATPESVAHGIQRCHQLGLKVMLKPMVDCRDGNWRGCINPSNAWFQTYRDFVAFWADVARDNNVEMFCVGCELVKTLTWSTSWRSIIQDIRSRYPGPLTYAANHGQETSITWWDDLDYIGIDAYYALTNKNDPTLAELQTAWNNRANAIQTWRNNSWPTKDIIFTEVGYQSVDGTNRTPWWRDPAANPLDLQEQAHCYQALLSVCRQRPWWRGAFWWNWETNPDAGGPNDPYHPMQNKPAQLVLAEYYLTWPGDFNDDHDVDLIDLAFLSHHWLHTQVVGDPDLNLDHNVTLADFAILSHYWLATD